MKPIPAPPIPGNTETERFENAARQVLSISKSEMQRREAEWQKRHAKATVEPIRGKRSAKQ